MASLHQTGSGMFSARAGRRRPGVAEKRSLINNSDVPFAERTALKISVADWCLRSASRCARGRAFEESAQWCLVAANTLDLGCEPLVSCALERQLVELAGRVPTPPSSASVAAGARPEHWLHVLNEAYPHGGHTATVQQWIRSAPRRHRHSVMLLTQRAPVPVPLLQAVAGSGGEVVRLGPDAPLLEQAAQLRAKAWADADVVVLHVHPWDVVTTLAFGVPGGPPVLLLNHAAHIFWTGASIADAALNLWASAQEDEWTRKHRGIDRILHLTIPLSDPAEVTGMPAVTAEVRQSARAALGLPPAAPVLLTSGMSYKYTPVPSLDFVETALAILKACPEAHLLAVGVDEDARWKAASEETGGRLRAVGLVTQESTATYRAASDVYLEGFPFGSTTALLEAGVLGLSCVRSPKTCPPPFASDDIAFAVVDRPQDTREYAARAIALVGDPRERERIGRALAASIRTHHTGTGWTRYLEEVARERPVRHTVRVLPELAPIPEHLGAFWANFATRTWNADPLDIAFRLAMHRGLRPRTDARLVREVRAARRGRGRAGPSAGLLHLTRTFLQHLPAPAAMRLYKWLLRLRPDGRIRRMLP